jgi:hypothetical protein
VYVDEGILRRSTGDITRAYAEISSDKGGENPPRRKSKGSWAR